MALATLAGSALLAAVSIVVAVGYSPSTVTIGLAIPAVDVG